MNEYMNDFVYLTDEELKPHSPLASNQENPQLEEMQHISTRC